MDAGRKRILRRFAVGDLEPGGETRGARDAGPVRPGGGPHDAGGDAGAPEPAGGARYGYGAAALVRRLPGGAADDVGNRAGGGGLSGGDFGRLPRPGRDDPAGGNRADQRGGERPVLR